MELGAGYGRDARFLAARGFRVRGVDLVGDRQGMRPGRPGRTSKPVTLVEGDALAFLRKLPAGRLDAVYSNMFFNMDFTEADHRRILAAIHRALRPGGWHLYSARSTADPWYGRGRKVEPDTYDPAPHGATMHYFSRAYSDRLAAGRFEPVVRAERHEGGREFPIRLVYVADRKPRRAIPQGAKLGSGAMRHALGSRRERKG